MRLIDADKSIEEYTQIFVEKFGIEGGEMFRGVIKQMPTAYDIDKIVEQCENVAERYADCDEFVCSKCGIHLVDWTEVSIDEDYDDEIHSEYVFKYCPNCGAKIKAGD